MILFFALMIVAAFCTGAAWREWYLARVDEWDRQAARDRRTCR